MATPSIKLIPAAYKIGKLYSILPTNGDGDFTVARADAGAGTTGTAYRTNSDGFLSAVTSDVPRLDYSDGTCPSLLTEPQSTNLVTYSNDFTNAAWTKSNATITDNAIISPDGTLNADKLVEDTATSAHYMQFANALTSGTTYTFSMFAKKGDRNWLKLDSSSNGNWSAGAFFDLENGVVGTIDDGTAKIEDHGNGWYKCSITGLCNASVAVGFLAILSTDGATTNYLGDGNSGVYTYQAQLEALSYATSPIFTNGATATRIADVVDGCGTVNDFNDSEGTFFLDLAAFNSSDVPVISISDGTITNEIEFAFFGTNQWNYIHRSSLGNTTIASTVTDATQYQKIALTWNATNMSAWLNGVEINDLAIAGTLTGLNELKLSLPNGSNNYKGKIRGLQVYKTALTDAELEYETSYRSFEELLNNFKYTRE